MFIQQEPIDQYIFIYFLWYLKKGETEQRKFVLQNEDFALPIFCIKGTRNRVPE
jgi:hypothetical protein